MLVSSGTVLMCIMTSSRLLKLCVFICHLFLFAVICRLLTSSMFFRLETSLVSFCLSFVCVLIGPLNVILGTFRRRYSPDSAATSAAVISISVARTSSVSGIDQQAHTHAFHPWELRHNSSQLCAWCDQLPNELQRWMRRVQSVGDTLFRVLIAMVDR